MKCPICNAEVESNLKTCPKCGAPIKEVDNKYVTNNDDYSNSIYKEKSKVDLTYEKDNLVSGILILPSTILAASGLVIMCFILNWALLALLPSIVLATISFFKARKAHFKQVEIFSTVLIIFDAIMILVGMVMAILYALNMMK